MPVGWGAWAGTPPPPASPFSRQGENLGQGSFTQIYKGIKRDQEEDGYYQTEVVLKVMDGSHRNCSEVRRQQPPQPGTRGSRWPPLSQPLPAPSPSWRQPAS